MLSYVINDPKGGTYDPQTLSIMSGCMSTSQSAGRIEAKHERELWSASKGCTSDSSNSNVVIIIIIDNDNDDDIDDGNDSKNNVDNSHITAHR